MQLQTQPVMPDAGHDRWQIVRYIINGLLATAVHFSVLTFNLKVLNLPSAGVANLCAAIPGISVSFLGSRYFVFRHHAETIWKQLTRFAMLYAVIAILHGLILTFWTDWLHLDYRIGFVLATGMQVLGSYWGNKFLVFNK